MTTVLIVDDEPRNLYMLEVVLKGFGYEVVTAENGAEALKRAREREPDLIVTDILMPVMDGFTLCRQWKADERLRDIPFVFYTATYTEQKDEEFALSLGADRFIVKPQEPDVLAEAVKSVLDESRAKKKIADRKPLGEEMEFFRRHNETLFHKLEQKMVELEREVVERRQAEAALGESREFLESLIENIPDIIMVKDAESLRFVRVNRAAEAMFGIGRAELYGKDEYALYPKAVADKLTERDRRVLAGKRPVVISDDEVDIVGSGKRILHTTKIPILDGDGGARYLLCISEDITERKKAESALLDSEERYRTLVAHSPDGILLVDLEGRFLSVNRAICDEMGLTEKEMLSMSIWDIIPEAHREAHQARLARIVRGEILDDTAEYQVRTKDGRRLLVEVRSAPYRKGGEIVGFQAIARDVTERRRAEAERERLLIALEKARGLQTVGMIASGVAHEVRNPLFAITTISAALGKKLKDRSEFEEHLAHIQEQTRRLNALMSDLLKLGRPIRPEEYEDCALRDIVGRAIDLLKQTMPGVDSRCELRFPAEVIAVRGVPGRLAQVVVNLLENALTFSPEDGVIQVGLDEADGMALLTVRDSGPGIPPEMMDRLFEPFATKRKGGTGLGLAIVRQIVTAHGGRVEAGNNRPDPGACFSVYLPIKADAAGPGTRE